MSFRFYLRIIADSAGTEIFNNTTSIYNNSDPEKIVVLLLKYGRPQEKDLTIDPETNFVNVNSPVFTVLKKQTFNYKELDHKNRLPWKPNITDCDYILFYINNFNSDPVDKKISSYLKTYFASTLFNNITGGWMLLARPSVDGKSYDKLIEKYNVNSNIELYYLTHTEFDFINKLTWNKLFITDSSDMDIATYYKDFLDDLDLLIYNEDSDYFEIIQHITHHIINSRKTRFESGDQIPYYVVNPDNLESDIIKINTSLQIIQKASRKAGIDVLSDKSKNTFKKTNFLTEDTLKNLNNLRSLYITIREKLYSKLML